MGVLFAAVYTLHMGTGESLCRDICTITLCRLDNSAGECYLRPCMADQLAGYNDPQPPFGVDPCIASVSLKYGSFPPPSQLLLDPLAWTNVLGEVGTLN
jgi:hypothetical protein